MKTLGVILAGGQSKRMGKKDKGQLIFKGTPLAHHVFNRLSPQVDQMIIAGPHAYDLPVEAVPDPVEGYQGPLMGLYAALLWNAKQTRPADALITAPVDCPYTPKDLVSRLVKKDTSPLKASYLTEGHQRHPTFALWPKVCLKALEEALFEEDIRAMKLWIDKIDASATLYDGAETLVNFNKPEDMKES